MVSEQTLSLNSFLVFWCSIGMKYYKNKSKYTCTLHLGKMVRKLIVEAEGVIWKKNGQKDENNLWTKGERERFELWRNWAPSINILCVKSCCVKKERGLFFSKWSRVCLVKGNCAYQCQSHRKFQLPTSFHPHLHSFPSALWRKITRSLVSQITWNHIKLEPTGPL